MMIRESDIPGLVEVRDGSVTALLRDGYADRLRELEITDCGGFLSHCESTGYRGRTQPLRVTLGAHTNGIVRRYRRAGVAGCLLRDTTVGISRALQEARVSEHARSRGVPTPEVLAAVDRRSCGLLHSGLIVTREIPNVVTLREHMNEEDGFDALTQPVAVAFRCLHDAGVAHHDLTLDNVLIGESGTVTVLDLDGCTVRNRVTAARRGEDLLRFRRSLHKYGFVPDDTLWEAFYETYAGTDRSLLQGKDAWMDLFRKRLPLYRLGWRLGV